MFRSVAVPRKNHRHQEKTRANGVSSYTLVFSTGYDTVTNTIERTHVRKSMSQRGEILMHLKELDAKRLVLSFVLPCFSKAFLSSGGGGWSEIEINTKQSN